MSSSDKIKEITLKAYSKRLEKRPMKSDFLHLKSLKEKLLNIKMKQAKLNKTAPCSRAKVIKVLKGLKRGTSRDPLGLANELFHPDVAGNDLIDAIYILMNRIKSEQVYPQLMEFCNISSIFKGRGKRNNINSYRGIFRITVFRNVLDRLIYEDEYKTIDERLTDSNIGARKGRNIRDNIFVVGAIINEVINGEAEAVDICTYDIEKCFDALWLEETLNDLSDTGLNNDKLPLLFLENENCKVAVKTPTGITERIKLSKIVMQGTVWGSIKCTTQQDKLGKAAYKNKEPIYLYKQTVEVPPIGYVDDVLTVSRCGNASVINNTIVNTFTGNQKVKIWTRQMQKVTYWKSK